MNVTEGIAGDLGDMADQDAPGKGAVESYFLDVPELPLFKTFILMQEL